MLKAGWLTAAWAVSDRNRQVRLYRLTPRGRKQLERKVNAFERLLAGVLKVMRPAAPPPPFVSAFPPLQS